MDYEKAIELLEQYGGLSRSLLLRKFGCSISDAVKILKKIVREHENVYFFSDSQIFIKGFEPSTPKKRFRRSKWKNIKISLESDIPQSI